MAEGRPPTELAIVPAKPTATNRPPTKRTRTSPCADPDETAVRYWLAGNLCRCTGYDKIIRAVLDAAATMRASGGAP